MNMIMEFIIILFGLWWCVLHSEPIIRLELELSLLWGRGGYFEMFEPAYMNVLGFKELSKYPLDVTVCN